MSQLRAETEATCLAFASLLNRGCGAPRANFVMRGEMGWVEGESDKLELPKSSRSITGITLFVVLAAVVVALA
jgi:hypothetical protein